MDARRTDGDGEAKHVKMNSDSSKVESVFGLFNRFLSVASFVAIALVAFACQYNQHKPGDFESLIAGEFERLCPNSNNCQLNLNEVTDFDWDKLYVGRIGLIDEEVNKIIGSKVFSDKHEFVQRLAFFRGDQLIFQETGPPILEHPAAGAVMFTGLDFLNGVTVFDSSTIFDARRYKQNDGYVYELTCINCR
jgi:hypothetical protein